MFHSLSGVPVILFVIANFAHCQQYVGDLCTSQRTGQTGQCTLLQGCPSALQALQTQQIFPQTCGFQGTQPIVCCVAGTPATSTPFTTRSTTRTTTRTTRATTRATPATTRATTTVQSLTTPLFTKVGDKSKFKCREYGKYVYVTQPPPIPLPGAEPITVDQCGHKEVELIVGGERARPREFPHMVLIGFDGDSNEKIWQCGGTLISENFVLTAGHCLFDKTYGEAKYLRIGDLIVTSNSDGAKPQEFNIATRMRHPQYTPPSQYNDIALLKMDRSATLNPFVRPACLFVPTNIDREKAIATGWGKVDFAGDTSDTLLKVTLEFFTHAECNESYKSNINRKLKFGIVDETQMCAGSKNEQKDTCQGDSGGPLQIYNKEVYCTYSIVGVTSFGKACGIANVPGVYTRVSNYIAWIESVVWP